MTEYVEYIPVVLVLAIALLREFAPKTRSDIDDNVLAALSKLEPGQVAHLQRLLDPGSDTTTGPAKHNLTGVPAAYRRGRTGSRKTGAKT